MTDRGGQDGLRALRGATADPLLGRVVGRWRVERMLGRGGFGRVYLVVDAAAQPAALKIFDASSADRETARARFLRGCELAAGFLHPNIVRVLDGGVHEETHYLVMSYVEGRSLAAVIHERGALGVEVARAIVVPLARAIGYLHSQRVIHRDVKPSNVLMAVDGTPVLTDFDLVRSDDADQSSLTRTGTAIGTAAYMSPEQLQGRGVGPPTDVYALGALWHELVVGEPPHGRGAAVELAAKIIQTDPAPVRRRAPSMPDRDAALLDRMLARDPAARPARLDALADALASRGGAQRRSSSGRIAARRRSSGRIPAGKAAAPGASSSDRRRVALQAGALLAVLLLVAVAAFVLGRRRSGGVDVALDAGPALEASEGTATDDVERRPDPRSDAPEPAPESEPEPDPPPPPPTGAPPPESEPAASSGAGTEEGSPAPGEADPRADPTPDPPSDPPSSGPDVVDVAPPAEELDPEAARSAARAAERSEDWGVALEAWLLLADADPGDDEAIEGLRRILVLAGELPRFELLRELSGRAGATWGLGFSVDGRLLGAAGADACEVWETETGTRVSSFEGHTGEAWAIAFTPGGRVASGGRDQRVRIWDPRTGAETHVIETTTSVWDAVRPHPRSERVWVASGPIELYDLITGERVRSFGGVGSGSNSICVSPDGRLIAADCWVDGRLRIQDAVTGDVRFKTNGGAGETFWNLAFDSTSRLLAAGGKGKAVTIVDVEAGAIIRKLPSPFDAGVAEVTFGRDGTLAFATGPAVILADPLTGKILGRLEPAAGNPAPPKLTSVLVGPAGRRLAIADGDGKIGVWGVPGLAGESLERAAVIVRVADGGPGAWLDDAREAAIAWRELRTADAIDAWRRVLAVRPHDPDAREGLARIEAGERVAGFALERSVTLDAMPEAKRHPPASPTTGARFVVAGDDGSARVIDAATGSLVATIPVGASSAHALDPTGTLLATMPKSKAEPGRIWSVDPPGSSTSLDESVGSIGCLFTPSGDRLLTFGPLLRLHAVEGRGGRDADLSKGSTGTRDAGWVTISPDGERALAVAWPEPATFVSHAIGRRRRRPEKLVISETGLILPDLRIVTGDAPVFAGVAKKDLLVANLATGEVVVRIVGAGKGVTSLAFDIGGETLVTASETGAVRRWDVRTGRALPPLDVGASDLQWIRTVDGGRRLIVVRSDRVDIWAAPTLDATPGGEPEDVAARLIELAAVDQAAGRLRAAAAACAMLADDYAETRAYAEARTDLARLAKRIEAARKKLESLARRRLQAADRAADDAPEQARELYRQILDELGEADLVRSRRSELEALVGSAD